MVSQVEEEPLNYSRGVHLPEILLNPHFDALLPSQGDWAAAGAQQWRSHHRLKPPLL